MSDGSASAEKVKQAVKEALLQSTTVDDSSIGGISPVLGVFIFIAILLIAITVYIVWINNKLKSRDIDHKAIAKKLEKKERKRKQTGGGSTAFVS